MRTHGPGPEHLAPWRDRITAEWRRVAGLGLGWRIGLVAVLVTLLAAGYWVAPSSSADLAWVFGGHAFAPDQVATARAVLRNAQINRVVVEARRIAVPADQLLPAQNALKKAKLDPRSFEEIIEGLGSPLMFENPKTREVRVDGYRAALAEHFIEKMPGIADAKVHFIPLPSSGLARKRTAKVVIDLQTDTNAPPSHRTVRDARDLALSVSDYVIKAEDVTLTGGGKRFLIAGDRGLLRKVLTTAKEEEWSEEITARLSDIAGLRVMVGLVVMESPPRNGARPRINEPVDVETEASSPDEARAAAESAQANVGVTVPRAYYQRRALARGASSYREDREQTEARIEETVRSILPAPRLASVTIEEDDRPISPTVITIGPSPSNTGQHWWVPAAVGCVIGAGALLCLTRLRGGRVPSPQRADRTHRADPPARIAVVGEDGPGPVAERVRAMVRHDPEVAAEVLKRWVVQGGPAS